MVLELLVRDEEDQHRDAIRRRAQERHQDRWDCAERGADQGDEVGEADPEREHTAERHVEYQQRDEGRAACDDADQEVAEDVAGERAGAVMEHGLDAPSSWWWQDAQGPFQHVGPVEDHEQREHDDGDRNRDRGGHALRHVERAAADLAELLVDLLPVLVELVALDEAADGALARLRLAHEPGVVVGELLALVHERADERVEHGAEQAEDDDEDDGDGEPAPQVEESLHQLHDGIEHDGEEGGHDQDRLDPGQSHEQPQGDGRGEHEADDGQDRAHRHRPRLLQHQGEDTYALTSLSPWASPSLSPRPVPRGPASCASS